MVQDQEDTSQMSAGFGNIHVTVTSCLSSNDIAGRMKYKNLSVADNLKIDAVSDDGSDVNDFSNQVAGS